MDYSFYIVVYYFITACFSIWCLDKKISFLKSNIKIKTGIMLSIPLYLFVKLMAVLISKYIITRINSQDKINMQNENKKHINEIKEMLL